MGLRRIVLLITLPVTILGLSQIAMAQSPTYGVGRTPSAEEIRAWDISISPTGKELPPGHGDAHDFVMTMMDARHPVTLGMPKQWLHPMEQLTHGQHALANPRHGAIENEVRILTYAYSKDSHRREPMDWVRNWDRGRIYVTMLGHTWRNQENPNCRCVGFQTLLARDSGAEDIVIGSPIANRNRHEVEPLIGSFMNTLALRANLSGDPTFAELLQRVRQTSLDAYAHQDLPFEKLVAELQPARNLSYSPIFQVMFILQNTPTPTTQTGPLKFAYQDIDAGSSKLDLTLNLEETADGCVGWLEYSTDLFDRSTIERIIQQFKFLLMSVVENPRRPLSGLASERVGHRANRQIGTIRSEFGNSEQWQRSSIEKKLASI